jgi:hypothetical protein
MVALLRFLVTIIRTIFNTLSGIRLSLPAFYGGLRSIYNFITSHFFPLTLLGTTIESWYLYFKDSINTLVVPTTVKIAASTAYISALYALVLGYIAAIKFLINSIVIVTPSVITGVWGWVMPPNTSYYLTVILIAHSTRFLFDWYIYFMDARYKAVLSLDNTEQ